MKKEIDILVEQYSQYLSEDIANLNIRGAFEKFKTNKMNFDNAEFKEEVTRYTNTIKAQIIGCKTRMLSVYKFSKRNDTRLLQNDKAFLSDLYFYLEYKKLITLEAPITKTIATYHRYSNDYFFDESTLHGKVEKIRVTQANLIANELNEYSFKDNKETNKFINQALNRNRKIFNEANGNYRYERFTFIGSLETFMINEVEYFIEYGKRDNGEITIIICNIDYGKKWLNYLNCLKANYLFQHPKDIKKRILEDALKKQVTNVEHIAQAINDLFFHCIEFHNRPYFEKGNSKKCNYGLLTKINNPSGIWFWKQRKYSDYIDSQNSILMILQELFIAMPLYDFTQLRDFVLFWIGKCINEPIHKGFQWGYSPFKEDVFALETKILNNHSDEKISLKGILKNTKEIEKNEYPSNRKHNKKNYKNFTWFKIGLKFATGEAHQLYNKYKNKKGHFKKITLELGFKETDRPFISETINNTTQNNNNIYSNIKKMKKISTHCAENKINTCDKFNEALKLLQQKQS